MTSTFVAFCFMSAISATLTPIPIDAELNAWNRYPEGQTVEVVEVDGVPEIRIASAEPEPVAYRQVIHFLEAAPGDHLHASVEAKAIDIREGMGVFMSISFMDSEDQRIDHADDYLQTGGRAVWTPLHVRGEAPEGTAEARLLLVIHGYGEGRFRNAASGRVAAEEPAPIDELVVLTATDEITVPSLIGFGAEDDGWFYNDENRRRGADDEAIAIREGRIEWMQPDYVRMFFWYNDWNPTVDGETFTWDSENMQSKYRTLDLYQRVGAQVNVTGVEWDVDNVWTDLEAQARSIGALLEHLIVEKGYSCVQQWTLTNEPNIAFHEPFETYVEMHRLVAREIETRGLDVQIVGSDDTSGLSWFRQCVEDDDYFELTDVFASHFYFEEHRMPFVRDIFRDRIDLLESRTPVKPFVVAEFGLVDDRIGHPVANPYMEDYANALWNHATYIDALNSGVAGIAIWCIHEMYYPGMQTPMQFGLWNFGDRDWTVRPVYHSVAAFTRNTQHGDTAYKVTSSHDHAVRAARVEDTVFWANVSDESVDVVIDGFEAAQVCIMTEDTLEGDRETGVLLDALNGSEFTVPPKSFGYATAAP